MHHTFPSVPPSTTSLPGDNRSMAQNKNKSPIEWKQTYLYVKDSLSSPDWIDNRDLSYIRSLLDGGES